MKIPFPSLPKTNVPELECRITEAVASITSNTEAKLWEETNIEKVSTVQLKWSAFRVHRKLSHTLY
jgi:hypothetical protein